MSVVNWPQNSKEIEEAVLSVLRNGRWAISEPGSFPPIEQKFAKMWATYCGSNFCIPTASGSSALVIALEALDIGPGDEVIVPIWTWVAPVTAILRVGAKPIFVDVSSDNYCLDINKIVSAINEKTRAIIALHLFSSCVPVDKLQEITKSFNIPIIEDCSQAHGSIYNNKKIGTYGNLATFSFQQSKVLTGGEGGAVITNDPMLAAHLESLRTDSCSWKKNNAYQHPELEPTGLVMGANYCMSEIHAAILTAQLPHLDKNLKQANKIANYLDEELSRLNLAKPLQHPKGLSRRTLYEYPIVLEFTSNREDTQNVTRKLSEDTGLLFSICDRPLNESIYFNPQSKKRFRSIYSESDILAMKTTQYPVANGGSNRMIMTHFSTLLESEQKIEQIPIALKKIRDERP